MLVLLDLNLPDMSGTDILEKIKSDDRLKKAPVVILTTTDDQREIQRCYALGCNVYITKPVEYETFATAIRQLGLFLSIMQVPETAVTDAPGAAFGSFTSTTTRPCVVSCSATCRARATRSCSPTGVPRGSTCCGASASM